MHLSVLAFTWFSLKQLKKEFSQNCIVQTKIKIIQGIIGIIRHHIQLCEKICCRCRYWQVRAQQWSLWNWRHYYQINKDIISFCSLFLIRKKTLYVSVRLIGKTVGSKISYWKVLQNTIKALWETCKYRQTYTPFVSTFLEIFCHKKMKVLCPSAFTESTFPFWENMTEVLIHLIKEEPFIYLRQIKQDAYWTIVFNIALILF